MISSSENYKKLIFTETKNSKNAEIYTNVLKELVQRYRDGSLPFSVDQCRNKFKKCVSECKRKKKIITEGRVKGLWLGETLKLTVRIINS